MYRENNFVIWLITVIILSLVGFAYAPFIMLFWNFVVSKLIVSATSMSYWQAYIIYLFFVVLPKIMPIRVTKNVINNDKRHK